MVISENILLNNGGEILKYSSSDFIFRMGSSPEHYLQIKQGMVKINTSSSGKEFLYGLPHAGHCIAESYMFSDKKYPFNAIAISNCEVIRLEKNKFWKLLHKNAGLFTNIYSYTAERIHYNNLMLSTFGCMNSIERIIILLNYIKEFYMLEDIRPFIIPYTRQQLASLTGLRTETVVRTVKKMEYLKLLTIINGKISY